MALIDRLRSAIGDNDAPAPALATEGEAQALADRLPDLLIEAMRVSNTLVHGIHGRRRSGPGETFWQFRHYEQTDDAALIDWRRSASSDQYFVREREWEAAHTFWLWANLSPSMSFKSHLAATFKRDRALVMLLAAAELLVRSGERVAYLGLTRPTASRRAASRIAETLAAHQSDAVLTESLPPGQRIARHSAVVLFSDFLDPPGETIRRMQELADGGAQGHLILILDPAEESLPYDGRTEFLSPGGRDVWVADRVEAIRSSYQERLHAHRDELATSAAQIGWSFMVHHTDRPAAEPLLSLSMRLQDRSASLATLGLTRGIA
ncbi:MAG: DUF58 domain-containing protein [Hyphomicrobiaceae bacterium]